MDLQNRSTFFQITRFHNKPAHKHGVKNFMANVFMYMFVALAISALFAYLFASNQQLLSYLNRHRFPDV